MTHLRTAGALSLLVGAFLMVAPASATAIEQRSFASPQEGFAALAGAIKSNDLGALENILGAEGHDVIFSGDAVADENARKAFTNAYAQRNEVVRLNDTNMALAIGPDAWEFPIPIAKTGNAWRFDSATGKEEVLNRRIGRNETAAVKTAHAYVQAQREYAAQFGGAYAQRVVSSSAEAKDGLYWPAADGAPQSPLGPLFANAEGAGYTIPKPGARPTPPTPYYGYLFRILKEQGPAARGGKRNYVRGGKMKGGFALIAYPASYGTSGVMTFIVNQDDKVFQKDLGPNTVAIARKITAFDPAKGWTAATWAIESAPPGDPSK